MRRVNGQRVAGARSSLGMLETYVKLARALGTPVRQTSAQDLECVGGGSHEDALGAALAEAHVALDSSRIRVGVTRGHLMEIVVQVPLDVAGDPEALQLGAEIYLETLLGTALLDEWVASVSVDRIARQSSLLVVADSRNSAPAHPLKEAASLVCLGVEGIRGQLPASVFAGGGEEGWTALEIPEVQSGLQSERRFASTRFPEALKCALSGMPFSSTRFTRGSEKFCWLSWRGLGSALDRSNARAKLEAVFQGGPTADHVLLSGSGFGPQRDYLDLWIELTWPELPKRISQLAEMVEGLEFGLYDSPYSESPLNIGG